MPVTTETATLSEAAAWSEVSACLEVISKLANHLRNTGYDPSLARAIESEVNRGQRAILKIDAHRGTTYVRRESDYDEPEEGR